MDSIQFTAGSLGRAYQAIQTAYLELAQLEGHWPPELNEYLYDEKYGGLDAWELMQLFILTLEKHQQPMQQLAQDVQNLSVDLNRVGRGDGFRV